MASNSTEYQENGGSSSPCGKLRVLFLASEWGSSKGGLSTMNRELAINTAQHSSVDVTFFVPQCNDEDKRAALSHKIKLVEATRQPGMEKLQWLSFLPDDLHIDVVVGHGIKLGPQANAIKKAQKCKWVQVVHTIPEELGMYKTYANPISGAEEKHKIEVELCQLADFVVSIGPKLNEAFCCYLSSCKKDDVVFNFTPGIFSEFLEVQQVAERKGKFQILLFGRGDEEDFLVKGFDLAAEAVASLDNIKLVFVGAPEGELEEVKNRFLKCGIRATDLTVRSFLKDRQSLKRLFCEVDLVVMPSRTEGFGLTALEALSAGLPILVSRNSGFGEALGEVLFGQYFVVHSDNVQEWVNAIKVLRDSDRKKRLKESRELRSSYAKTYCWKEQCEAFVRKMISLVQGKSFYHFSISFRFNIFISQKALSSPKRNTYEPTILTYVRVNPSSSFFT